jgi:hypothetical protein
MRQIEKINITYINEKIEIIIELTDKYEINQFKKYMKNTLFPLTPCGYFDGIVEFYNNENIKIVDGYFNFKCRQIIINYNGIHYEIRISDNGIIYLENIIYEIINK